jgi:hypothetical protein
VLDTLLGPEGSGVMLTSGRYLLARTPVACEPLRLQPLGAGWGRRRVQRWGRPYVENYTVDASILKSLCIKFLRANGGCLGTRNRRRT